MIEIETISGWKSMYELKYIENNINKYNMNFYINSY